MFKRIIIFSIVALFVNNVWGSFTDASPTDSAVQSFHTDNHDDIQVNKVGVIIKGKNYQEINNCMFLWSARNGVVPAMKYLVDECELDVRDKYDEALQVASDRGHKNVVDYLVNIMYRKHIKSKN